MMLRRQIQTAAKPPFFFCDFHPRKLDLQKEVLCGLTDHPKNLSPKLFYDEKGSDLFRQITGLEEYYLTRTEIQILCDAIPQLKDLLGKDCTLVEYGSGGSEKIKILLDALPEALSYLAIDISPRPLLNLAENLASGYPALEITAVCADFTAHLDLPLETRKGKRVVFFPGSSIGNFDPPDAVKFLHNISKTMGRRGGLLIGADLKKDPKILHAAYNDRRGITARFNLNLLQRINRECGANFDLKQFRHEAFYNENLGRIEMHLTSRKDQTVRLHGTEIFFAKGESIHTENSYKYSPEEFHSLAMEGGWKPLQTWTDPNKLFSVHYLEN